MLNFFLFNYQTFMTHIPGLTVNLVSRVNWVNSWLTHQLFFYLVIKLSWHESQVWWVNLIWRVNPVNSDFFSSLVFFFLLVFFFVFFFLVNLFNYHTFMTWSCSQTHIQGSWIWCYSQTHLNLSHVSLILLLLLL